MNEKVRTPSIEEVENFIVNRNGDDYFRFEDIQYGLKILSVVRRNLTLEIKYSFISDPSVHDEQQYELFEFDEDYGSGFFPDSLNLITMQAKHTWPDSNGIENLCIDECIESEESVIDSCNLPWDAPDFPPDVFSWAIEQCGVADPEVVAYSLIHKYDAKNVFPEFIPMKLAPYFKKWINEFTIND